jgi:nickel superoxide dismutase
MKKTLWIVVLPVVAVLALPGAERAFGHCEVPCGIYGDRARIQALREHCDTVEKAMRQITALAAAAKRNDNQVVRWVMNKESHAGKIQEIVSRYFLHQRVKPVDDVKSAAYRKYVTRLTLLHRMLVTAMKCKQTTDTAHVRTLRSLIDRFEGVYFEGKAKTK